MYVGCNVAGTESNPPGSHAWLQHMFHDRSPDLLTSNGTKAAMCMKDNKVIAIEGCIMLRCNVCMHELHWLCISCCAFLDVKELAGSQFKDSIPSTGILVTKF